MSFLLLSSCSKNDMAGEHEENLKLSPHFEFKTDSIDIISYDMDIDECFYKNNFIKLIASDPNIKDHSWYKCYPGADNVFISNDSFLMTSSDGEYRLDAEYNIPGSGETDTCIYISLNYCTTGVEIPSSFVPDADGQFDTWFPIFNGVSDFYVRVTDEAGNILFESTSESNVFDGTYNNLNLPSNSYFYYISGSYRTGYIFEQQGVLELVR